MLTAEDFSPHIGKAFAIAGRPEVLTLASVEKGRPAPTLQRQPFMLVFQSARDKILPEGFYKLDVDGENFELYVMPIMTPPGDRQDYQAVFN